MRISIRISLPLPLTPQPCPSSPPLRLSIGWLLKVKRTNGTGSRYLIWCDARSLYFSFYPLGVRNIVECMLIFDVSLRTHGLSAEEDIVEDPAIHIPCLVLSCLVLSCLVLSCLVLSCLVLSCLVLSCLVLSRLVLSCLCSALPCRLWLSSLTLPFQILI